MGENHFARLPTAVYGGVLFMASVAFFILSRVIIRAQGEGSVLKQAIGGDWKGKASPLSYLAATVAAFWSPWLAQAIYVVVALMWLIPDRRIERVIPHAGEGQT